MSKPTDAWMPLYIGDYLADTQHLSYAEHGVYLLLIMAYWRHGGPLPDDNHAFRMITKASPEQWKKLRPRMSKFFDLSDGENWRHKRIDAELAAASRNVESRSKAGKIAASARWHNGHDKSCESHSERNADALPQNAPSPSPLEDLSLKDRRSSKSGDYVAECAREGTREAPSGRAGGVSLGRPPPPPLTGEGENTAIAPALIEKMAKLHGNEPVARALSLVESRAGIEQPAAYFVAICRGHAKTPPPQATPPPEFHPPRPTPEKIEALRIQYGISREDYEQTLRELRQNEAA